MCIRDRFRNQYVAEMGMVVPTVKVRASARLGPDDYEILIYGVPVGKGQAMAERWLAIHPAGVTKTVRGLETRDPTYGLPAVWIEEDVYKRQGPWIGMISEIPDMSI